MKQGGRERKRKGKGERETGRVRERQKQGGKERLVRPASRKCGRAQSFPHSVSLCDYQGILKGEVSLYY